MLGPHSYTLTDHLTLPVGCALIGAGAAHTQLLFTLSPGRHSAAAAITASSNSSVQNLSLTITAATNQSNLAAVAVPRAQGFVARGLSISMEQPNMGSAFELDGW